MREKEREKKKLLFNIITKIIEINIIVQILKNIKVGEH